MASLQPSESKLGLRKAKHLLRRATFNYSKSQIELFADKTPEEALDLLTSVSTDYILQKPYDPDRDGYWTDDYGVQRSTNAVRRNAYVTGWWWYNAMQSEVSLKYKLSFFLHTCFTVGKDSGAGYPAYFFDHLRLLDFYAFGNIKNLAKKINLDDAMLNYLDNTKNKKNSPNENYAREFLELFTILKGEQVGVGDYTTFTEIDVQQAARVFTGFRRNVNNSGRFVRSEIDDGTHDGLEATGLPRGIMFPNLHYTEPKQFSDRFDNTIIETAEEDSEAAMIAQLHNFVDMVFRKRQTARSYCRKLYRYFVKSTWDEDVEDNIIEPLTDILYDSNYDILPVVKKLLSSQHFYDEDDGNTEDEIIGSIIKSPLQLVTEIVSMFDVQFPDLGTPNREKFDFYDEFYRKFLHNRFFELAGFGFFDPESVAGYPAYFQPPAYDKNWFSSNTVIARFGLITSLIKGENELDGANIDLHTNLDSLAFAENNISDPTNPTTLVTETANLLYPEAINEDRVDYFRGFLLRGSPDPDDYTYWYREAWSYHEAGSDSEPAKSRLDALITAMVNAVEFQVM